MQNCPSTAIRLLDGCLTISLPFSIALWYRFYSFLSDFIALYQILSEFLHFAFRYRFYQFFITKILRLIVSALVPFWLNIALCLMTQLVPTPFIVLLVVLLYFVWYSFYIIVFYRCLNDFYWRYQCLHLIDSSGI